MLDIDLFREHKGYDPELIRESQRRRFANVEIVDEIICLDKEWRRRQVELENLRSDINRMNKATAWFFREDKDAADIVEKEIQEAKATLFSKLETIGNIVDGSVPVGDDEANNEVIRLWGEKRMEPKLKYHVELIKLLGIAHLNKKGARNVFEGRGYSLKEAGILLSQALVNFGISFLLKRSYKLLRTPFFMRKDIVANFAQPAQFHNEIFKVTTGEGDGDGEYVIPTAEHSVCARHLNDLIHPSQLPIRYAGYSTYIHKEEARSRGRGFLGVFRVRQFEEVEQLCLTIPNRNESWTMHDQLIENSEDFYKALSIPYRVVSVVSGALNHASAKTYKLEAWFPASQTYKELVSCSNFTDYRTRRLNIRYGQKGSEKDNYIHLLSSTLTTTEKTICCILENYQTEDGVEVPKELRPFMGDISFLPFKAESPKVKGIKFKAYMSF